MSKSLIFGHKNPDTDTICSAIVFADLKTRLGENVEAVRLGAVNGETQFVLNHFGVEAPRQVETVSNEVETSELMMTSGWAFRLAEADAEAFIDACERMLRASSLCLALYLIP